MRAQARPKNPRKRPPDPRDPRVQTLLFMAQSRTRRNAHMRGERWIQIEHGGSFVADLVLLYGYRCMHCGARRRLTLDHIRPVCKGGKTELENLQLLCEVCNEAKDDQIIDYRPKLPGKG